MKKLLGIVVLSFLLSGTANAQCYTNPLGSTYCPPPGGGLGVNGLGTAMCGLGGCVKDAFGTIICSNQQHGYATKNALGTVKCTGRCVRGVSSLCQRM